MTRRLSPCQRVIRQGAHLPDGGPACRYGVEKRSVLVVREDGRIVADDALDGPGRRIMIGAHMDIATTAPILSVADDFPPFELVDGDPAAGVLVVCDHAANRLPTEYGDLGPPASEFQRHIAVALARTPAASPPTRPAIRKGSTS